MEDKALSIKFLVAITDTAAAEGFTRKRDRCRRLRLGGTEPRSDRRRDGQETGVERSRVEELDFRDPVETRPASSDRSITGVWRRR